MKIAAIVNRKGRQFETVNEMANLAQAAEMMNRLSIGSVGVAQGNTPVIVGLLSQQELTAAIAQHGARLERPGHRLHA